MIFVEGASEKKVHRDDKRKITIKNRQRCSGPEELDFFRLSRVESTSSGALDRWSRYNLSKGSATGSIVDGILKTEDK